MRSTSNTYLIGFVIITACGGSDTPQPSTITNSTLLVEKSSPPLTNNFDGAFALDTPLTLHFHDAKQHQPDLPRIAHTYKQTSITTENFFWLDDKVIRVSSIIDRQSEFTENMPVREKCIYHHLSHEAWERLHDNNYRVFNNGLSTEVVIQSNSEALFITKPAGNMRFPRIDREVYNNIPLCIQASQHHFTNLDILDNQIKTLPQLSGLWLATTNVEPFDVGYSRDEPIQPQQRYLDIDDKGNSKEWLFDKHNRCFSDAKHTARFSFMESTSLIIKVEDFNKRTENTRTHLLGFDLNVETSNNFYGNKESGRHLYFYNAYEPTSKAPYFLSQASKELSIETMQCQLSTEELNSLNHVKDLYKIEGVWDLRRDNSPDFKFLHINDDLVLTHYDYRGDKANNGEHCYQKIKMSSLIYLGNNLFEENVNKTLNNLIELRMTDQDELVLRLQNKSGNEYNRPLEKSAELTQSGISPLCPSVRN